MVCLIYAGHLRDDRHKAAVVSTAWYHKQQKKVPPEKFGQFGYGDPWTLTAIDADSKLIVSYLVGQRDMEYATEFMHDICSRLAN